jgi:hypothetical protein
MRNSSKYIMGALLVLGGIAMAFGNFGIFSLSWLFRVSWPMIFIVIAVFFFLGFMTKRPYGAGLLVPAGIMGSLGIIFLIGESFSYRLVWPGFIAAPAVGLLLLYIFAERRSGGLLVPVGILMTIASVCFISELFNIWEITWPGFIMAPAVGLFLLYLTSDHSNGLLVPIFILTAIAVTFFVLFTMGRFAHMLKYIIGGALILGGLSTILKQPRKKDNGYSDDYGKPRY